jgi:anaerobic magnesium-protoporphyrin IX monomethyl ester cyclase
MTKRLDLLLINPGGREKIYQQLGDDLTAVEPPLWCRLIGSYILDRGFSVEIIDSEAMNWNEDRIAAEVRARDPLLVGMIVFGHQPSASTQQMTAGSAACAAIKALEPDRNIIIAGGHVSALPEQTITDEPVDWACNGEGPLTFEQLLTILRDAPDELDELDFASVEGLVWRDGDAIQNNTAAPLIREMDRDLHGNVWHLLPMERYRAHNWHCFGAPETRQPYASIYTSLGCPFRCTFCCINAPFGVNRYRMRTPENVVAEIDLLYREYGVRTIKIIDEMFVLNDRHVTEICRLLAEKPYANELNFWAYARIDTVKPDMLALLRSAGIRWLALGIESGSEHVRDGAEKSFTQDDIRDIVRQIQMADISVIGNYIFGLPDDNLTTMRQTLDLAKELNCEFANFYSAMAYPGSQLFNEAVAQDLPLPEQWSGYSQHSFDCTPLPTDHLPASEVLRFRDAAFHEYFESKRFLDMTAQKFGVETRDSITEITRHRLRRQLLEEGAES